MKTNIKLAFTLLIALAAGPRCFSQVSLKWAKRFDNTTVGGMQDQAQAMAIDKSGNVYVTGVSYFRGDYEGRDYLTIKYDSSGNIVWQRNYDGPGSLGDFATDIAIDPAGNIVVTGGSRDSVHFNQMATVKYDAGGNQLWDARLSVSGTIGVVGNKLEIDTLGYIYVTGAGGYDSTDHDFITAKYSPSGALQWMRAYDGSNMPGVDRPKEIKVDRLGNVYVAGQSKYDTVWSNSYGAGGYTVVKYDATGNELWVKKICGSHCMSQLSNMVIDDAGNIYLTGDDRHVNSGDYSDIMTVKYNADGNLQWKANFNGPIDGQDMGLFIKVDNNGNVYVFGTSMVDDTTAYAAAHYVLIKYNASGSEEWAKFYLPQPNCSTCSNQPGGMALDANGNIFITASSTMDMPYRTFRDYTTIKYSPAGVLQWVEFYDGVSNRNDTPEDIITDNKGHIYVTGKSDGSGSQSDEDYLTIKYQDLPLPLNTNSMAENDIAFNFANPFSNSTIVNYRISQASMVSLEVFDALGKRIKTLVNEQRPAGTYKVVFDASNCAEGLYFCTLKIDQHVITKKMVCIK